MERDRGDRRDDRFSNTYRPRSPGPRARSPPGDGYRSARSPPRRGLASADTYTPGSRAPRPRSRSPVFRRRSRSPRRDDSWRARPRSPPPPRFARGRDEPRRDDYRSERARSPRRDAYDSYARSPRPRDVSPARSRGMRSPLRSARYEEPPRRYSPVRDYRRRSPSPRRDRTEAYAADTWRARRSPSPSRPSYASNEASGRDSAATSRRSSPPPIHPSRAALVVEDRPTREAAPMARSPYRERERERERERSAPRRRDSPPAGPRGDRDFAPPSAPSSHRNGNGDSSYSRAPPTGPSSRAYPDSSASPPPGSSSAPPQAPPSYPRGSNPVLTAPTRPRGGGRGFGSYDAPRDFSGPSGRRGSWGTGPRGGGYYGSAPPGPRGGGGGSAPFAPSFRGSSNSTATTYPRTMRFRDHLADLPKEVPGGQRAPELYDKSRILKLEEEARKLRELIERKEDAKRQKLREWDSLERDAETAQLRVDLAESSLRSLNGEGDASEAF